MRPALLASWNVNGATGLILVEGDWAVGIWAAGLGISEHSV